MTDHGPRYEVFKQEREGAPFRNIGSVHAPDAELALLAARDVFARRPACHSLWVVPASVIVARSIQEPLPDAPPGPIQLYAVEPYAVCAKQSQRQAMTYVDYLGWVEAHSAAEALRLAPAAFGAPEATVWWAFPEAAVTMSDPADAPGLEAATGKRFRLPNQYHTVFTMQQIRRAGEGDT
jgi:ring-1,2-phenylacetyl-CoA epoxidase subunit PaaB